MTTLATVLASIATNGTRIFHIPKVRHATSSGNLSFGAMGEVIICGLVTWLVGYRGNVSKANVLYAAAFLRTPGKAR